jgi:ATPase subunit of ABC transporter with duplicated ATPase domains
VFDAASDRFDDAGRVLEAAGERRAQARRDRYAARQACERAALTADQLEQRVADLSGRLDQWPS